jgi:hypothetical protein
MLLATKKPIIFYSFLLVGVALFLWLTMTTEIKTAEGMVSLFYLIFAQAGKGL